MRTLARKSRFKWLLALVTGCVITAFGQKQTKYYSESFSVNEDVTIDVNTSYTDVEFETWNKDVVEIEAFIEVEGISKEEAEAYFKGWDFEALGNSGKVSITAKSGPRLFTARKGKPLFSPGEMDFDFKFEMPEMEELQEMEELARIEPLMLKLKELPPMPPIPFDNFGNFSFDYEAYKEEGDAYLERWKKEFTENFDRNFKPKFEAWKKELEARNKELQAHERDIEKYRAKAEINREKLKRIKEAQHEKMAKIRASVREARKVRAKAEREKRSNVFYFKEGAEDKNIKVKKTIKIKMPKGARLKMDIRHGEVKLAENFKNIKATLSHTRLLAARVDGAETHIEASFSPILVEHWNKGKLKVNYVKNVALKHVKSVDLSSTSSDVVIGNIADNALIKGSFGKLEIKNVSNNFKHLDMVLDNTDAIVVLPRSAFNFYCNTTNSKVNFPDQLRIDVTKKYAGLLAKGYHRQKNSNKNINLTAMYSEVVIR